MATITREAIERAKLANEKLKKLQKFLINKQCKSYDTPHILNFDNLKVKIIYLKNNVEVNKHFQKAKTDCRKIFEDKKDYYREETNKKIDNLKEKLEQNVQAKIECDKVSDIVQAIKVETKDNQTQLKFKIENGIVFVNRIIDEKLSDICDVICYKDGKICGVISAMPEASPVNSRISDIMNEFKISQSKDKGHFTSTHLNELNSSSLNNSFRR